MNRQWDAVIVGARVSGAATAMLLARAGLRVLCIDRSRYGSDTISTHALMRGGVLQLQRWGLLDDVLAAGTPRIQRAVFHVGDDDPIAISIKPSDGVDALVAPRRTVLDALLVDHAARAGATFDFGARVVGVHRDASGAVAGVRVRGMHQLTTRIERAPLVIGADGRGSTIGREVAAAELTDAGHASSFLYAYWANLPNNGYEWFFRQGLTAGAIPTNDGLTCVFVGARAPVLDAAVQSGTVSAVFERLSATVGLRERLAGAHRIDSPRYVHALPASYLRTAHGQGWALVGDAGHWLDPMSTHGMTGALRDAGLLAQAVISTQPGSSQRRDALTHYQDVRDRLSLPMVDATDEIAGYAWDMTRIRTLLRNMSSAMTDEVETLASLTTDASYT